MTESLFGVIVDPWDVEEAVLTTLRSWFNDYLAEIERQKGLQPRALGRPPTPESYHGATKDAIAWAGDELPAVIVIVEPTGEPEREASTGYTQCYGVEVWCIVMGDDGAQQTLIEDSARMQAARYGGASMLLVQHGSLGGLAERTVMVGSPRTECPEPENRREHAAITTFHVWVSTIIRPDAGPVGATPKESPEYGGAPEAPFAKDPTVTSGGVTVTAKHL